MLKKIIYLAISITFLFQLPLISYANNESLIKGEIQIEDDVSPNAKDGSVKMIFAVKAEPEEIWNILVDYEKWPQFMDDLEKVEVRRKNETSAIVFVKAKAPMNLDISYTLKRNYFKKDYKITWSMLSGKAKAIEGSWQIIPINNNYSKLIYTNYLDLGFVAPVSLVSLLTKRKLPNLAKGIINYINKKH